MSGRTLPHDWYLRPLPSNVVIGDRSWLYSCFAFLHYRSEAPCGVRIGNDTGVYHSSFFELGPEGETVIGDYCTLVGAIIRTNGRVEIGDYAFLAHEVVVADSPFAAPDTPAPGAPVRTLFRIGRNAWIEARAILLPGAVIGEGAIVGAGAVIDFEVPPYSIAAGNPASIVGKARPGGSS